MHPSGMYIQCLMRLIGFYSCIIVTLMPVGIFHVQPRFSMILMYHRIRDEHGEFCTSHPYPDLSEREEIWPDLPSPVS